MSKIKFGNFITYNGKYLSTAMSKAQSGNLVFARIINSPAEGDAKAEVTLTNIIVDGVQVAEKKVNNVGKDGYYIFGGKADGHLVTYDVFNATKKELKELIGAGEREMPKHKDGSYYSIVEYVNSRLDAYKVKDVKVGSTSIVTDGIVTLGDAAQKNVAAEIVTGASGLATAGQVYDKVKAVQDAIDAMPTYGVSGSTNISVTASVENGKHNFTLDITDKVATKAYVDDKVSSLGDVMSFIGVVSAVPTDKNVTLTDGKTVEATAGDVVTIASTDEKSGTEYVWTGSEWVEIGRVATDEAVTSLGGVKGDILLSDGLSMVGQQLTVTFPVVDVQGEQKTTTVKGKAAIGVTGVADGNNTEYEVSLRLGTTGNVTLLQDSTHGLTAHVDAEDLVYVYTKAGATVQDVKGALNELYDDKEVVAQALVDLKSGISGLDTRLDTIEADYVKSVSLQNPTEDSPYITITPTEGDVKIDLNVYTTNEAILSDQADDALVSAAGLRDYSKAVNITYAGATGVDPTNVEDALDNLFEQVAALNSDVKDASEITYTAGTDVTTSAGVDKVNEALDDLYTQLATLGGAAVTDVQGDTASYSQVESSKDDERVKIVKNVLADNVVAEDGTTTRVHGLVTDEYLDEVLAWEDITD